MRSFYAGNIMFIIDRERLDKVCDIRKNIKESIVVSIFEITALILFKKLKVVFIC